MLLGLVGVAAVPAGWVVQDVVGGISLFWASLAAIPAVVFGLAALSLARGVRRRAALTLGGIAGERAARVGRLLGFLAVYAAVTIGLALAFYALLEAFGT